MKERFNRTTWRAVSGIAASFLLVVSFQNCGKAGFDSELDGELDLSSDAALVAKYGPNTAQKVTDIPFAFDAGFDTITYNSCADKTLKNSDAYFALKAGSFSSGGIKLKDTFFDYVNQNFDPIYPATTMSTLQYKELLSDSPMNKDVSANVAIRVKNSLTDVYVKTKGSLLANVDVIPMVGLLTDPLVMDSFANRGVTATYFPFSPEFRIMQGAFSLGGDNGENESQLFRQSFDDGLLAITFTPPNQEIFKVVSTDTTHPVATAQGKGYSLEFAQFPGSQALANSRVLASVRESDLASPTTSIKTWKKCRAYKVIRAADALLADPRSNCPAHTQAEIKGSDLIRTELEVARRHLRSDQWDVNVTKECVVPKVVSCYEEKQYAGAPIVQYDPAQPCRTNAGDSTYAQNSQCLHFISICTN